MPARRRPRPSRRSWSFQQASGDGGLCCVSADEKSLHEEELGQPAREQYAGLGTSAGVGRNWRRGGGSGYGVGTHGRGDRQVFRRFIRNASVFSGQQSGDARHLVETPISNQQSGCGLIMTEFTSADGLSRDV